MAIVTGKKGILITVFRDRYLRTRNKKHEIKWSDRQEGREGRREGRASSKRTIAQIFFRRNNIEESPRSFSLSLSLATDDVASLLRRVTSIGLLYDDDDDDEAEVLAGRGRGRGRGGTHDLIHHGSTIT